MKGIKFRQDGRFYYGWVIVFLGFLLMTFSYVGFVSLTSIFVLPVTEELGFERGDFMSYMMILSFSCIIVSPFAGKMVGKKNPKLIISIGCILGLVGYLGFSTCSSLIGFYLYAVILGAGFAMTAPMPASVIINNWFGGKIRGTATGLAFIGSGLGGMILSPILNLVISNYGWRIGYIALACIYILILLPCVLLLCVGSPEAKGFVRMGETLDESKDKEAVKAGLNIKEASKTPELYLAALSTILVVFASSAILANDVSFYVGCGIDSSRAASLHGLMLGSMILGKPLMGMFIDRVGIKIGSTVSTIIFALVFLTMLAVPLSLSLVYAIILCYCLGAPSITIVPPLMVNGLFGEKDYGTIVGLMNTSTSIGGAFGATVAAKIYDVTGSYNIFWVIAAIGVFLSAFIRLLGFMLNKKRNTWSSEN